MFYTLWFNKKESNDDFCNIKSPPGTETRLVGGHRNILRTKSLPGTVTVQEPLTRSTKAKQKLETIHWNNEGMNEFWEGLWGHMIWSGQFSIIYKTVRGSMMELACMGVQWNLEVIIYKLLTGWSVLKCLGKRCQLKAVKLRGRFTEQMKDYTKSTEGANKPFLKIKKRDASIVQFKKMTLGSGKVWWPFVSLLSHLIIKKRLQIDFFWLLDHDCICFYSELTVCLRGHRQIKNLKVDITKKMFQI